MSVRARKFWILGAMALAATAALSEEIEQIFNRHQKAAYLSQQELAFIRPGLTVQLLQVTVANDGTVRTRFRITDPRGLPLDRNGVFTPGPVATSFVLARIPSGRSQYVAYTSRNVTSPITGNSAEQAAADTGGTYERVADGEYWYTFGRRLPSGYERNVTHTVGVYATRNLSEFGLGNEFDDGVIHFVPDGSEVRVKREVVANASCNACHGRLSLHGGARSSIDVCVLCHTPQSTDPDTGNTVDFAVMIHKIHRGADLPSVRAGTPYRIIGFGQSVHDYSTVHFPAGAMNCTVCHDAARASQANNYLTRPSRAACGSCHDNVNFATGQNHLDRPQVSDNQCSQCHIPEGEVDFDVSIVNAHTEPRFSKSLPGTRFELLSAADTAPGRNPTITFSITDNQGAPVAPSSMARLALVMAGNTIDFSRFASEDARTASGSGGTYMYTFRTAIPQDASGTWAVGIEGYRNVTLLPGTVQERVVRNSGENKVLYFPVTDSQPVPRRKVVAQEKCNACHLALDFHGNARNHVEFCVLCHNPRTTDTARRPAASMPAESVNFKEMIHKIHTGEELTREYTVFGFGSVPFTFNEVRFPNDRRNCSICHIDGTEQLPLQPGLLSATTPRDYFDPQPPISGACLSCHTKMSSAAHADVNISPRLGESCEACHGPQAQFSIDRVHAR